jgi:uncharacterized membrane protein
MKRIQLDQLPDLKALLKDNFFAGLLILIPLAVIAWMLAAAIRWVWALHWLLPADWRPENLFENPLVAFLFNAILTVGAAAFLALGVSVLGWVSKQYIGRTALELVSEVILRIPVIRTVYSALDQLLKTFAGGSGGKQFSRVVYVEYPRAGSWTLAFVTGTARSLPPSIHGGTPMLNVYVPTTPNPTSGFYLVVPETEVRDSGLSVEEAFKVILSLGIAQS